ncbi:complex I assembly factor TIMMDC1, mitochondrial [Nematolebias whitei]|uniref:complex I assembly factor TIMMDC1, mitochondrial n=1 Tax=Nematolebias whitei TaxID=451745 RepID=UPI00189776CB|nr:complex I assembly factor TIMMDC1, mitochondrial [Nematolebias whitei]
MRPEQHGARLAPADSTPGWSLMCTNPLRGPAQTAGSARFFCSLFPRVHAADVGAQPPPSSSLSSASPAPPVPAPQRWALPSNIGKPEFPDTGWKRIQELFDFDKSNRYPEELVNLFKLSVLSAVTGFSHGGLMGARVYRKNYIKASQAEVYTSRMEAVQMAQNAAVRGFLRYGWRWSWRFTLITTLFGSVTAGLSVYRDKEAMIHYLVGGAVAMGLYRIHLGLRGLVAGSVLGVILGAPAGAMFIGLQKFSGETWCERRKRERREVYELRLQEWAARLELTDELISSLNVISEEEQTVKDLQRVQALLSLPRNAGESPVSSPVSSS